MSSVPPLTTSAALDAAAQAPHPAQRSTVALWAMAMGLLGLGLLLIAVEALNTALEVLVDHLSPGWSAWAKEAKDLGSLAVACTIGTLALYSGVVLIW